MDILKSLLITAVVLAIFFEGIVIVSLSNEKSCMRGAYSFNGTMSKETFDFCVDKF